MGESRGQFLPFVSNVSEGANITNSSDNVSNLNSTLNESNSTVNDTVSTVVEPEPDTIVKYCRPSAWNNNMKYKLYKVTYDSSILNRFVFNCKNTYEGEWSEISTDMDFDAVTGNEKMSGSYCNKIKKYILKVESV